jgi:hypothetical protein
MNIADVKHRVLEIERMKGDNESAHFNEDSLYEDFVIYIAKEGTGELAELAKEILKTQDIKFDRWYA